MSNLEKLPTELLVDIFLYSMNIDLPRSSPVIGGKLTSKLVYTRTVIAAFGPTWDAGYGNYRSRDPNYHGDDFPLSGFPPEPVAQEGGGVGDGVLQSAILRCRWASLPVIQKSQETWVERYCKERPFKPLPFVVNLDLEVERKLQKQRIESQTTPAKFFEEDFAAFSAYLLHSQYADITYSWATYVDVASNVEIPQSLLLGPWTEERIRHLFWLVKGGAQFDWLNSTSGEAAMLGLRSAVGEGDLRLIHLLFWAGLTERVDIETVIWVIRNAGTNRIQVVEGIVWMFAESHSMNLLEMSLIEKTLAEIKDQAVVDSDEETMAFVQAIGEWFDGIK